MRIVADVFISYSREDVVFAQQLRVALTSRGCTVWIDTGDIAPTSVWRRDIMEAIEAAGAVLFVLSPGWLASEVSQRELQYALEMHKKLVPVVYRYVDHRLVNPALSGINWIFAQPSDNPATALQNILFAISTDLDYWRDGGDLLVKASQWNRRNRNPTYTLRGEALRRAEQWLAAGASKRPAPGQLQIEYINAGRHAAAARQRTTITSLSVGIVITLILAIIASSLAVVNQQQNLKLGAQNRQLAGEAIANEARALYTGNQIDLALLLAVAAYKLGKTGDLLTRSALFSLVHQSPHLETILHGSSTSTFAGRAVFIGYSSDGNTEALVQDQRVTIRFLAGGHSPVNFSPPPVPPSLHADIIGGAVSSDGSLVALKTRDVNTGSQITIWNTSSGKQVGQLDGLTYEQVIQEHNLAFSPDGRLVASAMCPDPACHTTQFTIWNVKTDKIITQIPGSYPIGTFFGDSVSFSADGRYVAFSECENDDGGFNAPSRVVAFDTQQDAPAFILTYPTQITTVAFTPAPRIMAVASTAGPAGQVQNVTFWNVVKQAQVTAATPINDLNPIQTVEFSSQGNWMLTADTDHAVNLWAMNSSYAAFLFTEDITTIRSTITAVAFSPSGDEVTTSSNDGQINVWRLSPFTSASPDASLTFGGIPAVVFSPDGQSIFYTDDLTSSIGAWNIEQGQPGESAEMPPNSLALLLAVSRDGSLLAITTVTNTLAIIDRTTGKVAGSPWQLPSGTVTALQFSPDGRTLLTCVNSDNGGCYLYDTQSHALVRAFGNVTRGQVPEQQFTTAAFSPDGHSLAFAVVDSAKQDSKIEVYDVARSRVTATLDIGGTVSLVLSWSANSRYIGYLDIDGDLAIWSGKTGAHQIQVTKLPSGLTASFQFMEAPPDTDPGSLWIMAASGRSVELWQVDPQHNHASEYLDPLYFPNTLFGATVSPSGEQVAVGEYTDGLIAVVSLDPHKWIDQACSIADRNLTIAEWQTYVQKPLEPVSTPYTKLCPDVPA